ERTSRRLLPSFSIAAAKAAARGVSHDSKFDRGSLLAQTSMNERHRHRPLSHGRSDTLQVPETDIADGEHAGPAGLEQVGWAWQRPLKSLELLMRQSGPVLMNPFSSSARHPSSHFVLGTAPAITKTCRIGRVATSPVEASRHVTCPR